MREDLAQAKQENGSYFRSRRAYENGDPVEYAHRLHQEQESRDGIRFQEKRIKDMESQQKAIQERLQNLGGNTANKK